MYNNTYCHEEGSPTNPPWAPGSDKTWSQGSFGLRAIAFKRIRVGEDFF